MFCSKFLLFLHKWHPMPNIRGITHTISITFKNERGRRRDNKQEMDYGRDEWNEETVGVSRRLWEYLYINRGRQYTINCTSINFFPASCLHSATASYDYSSLSTPPYSYYIHIKSYICPFHLMIRSGHTPHAMRPPYYVSTHIRIQYMVSILTTKKI